MANKSINLDDPSALAAVDETNMMSDTVNFAGQCEDALEIGRLAETAVDVGKISNILVLGMGGSGISGDVLRVLFDEELTVPLSVNRHYRLPGYVGADTLVVAASYSGNTEETLSGLSEAVDRGAQAIVISNGGKISQIAVDNKLTLVKIPAGFQPRAVLGYLSLPLAVVFEKLGLVGSVSGDANELLDVLRTDARRYGPDSPESQNPAKQLARRLLGKMPVIYGTESVTGLAAFRCKCQINENSKSPAQWNLLPELDHNEITGWQLLPDISRRFHLIFFRDEFDHPQVKKRIEITRDLILDQFCGADEFWSKGRSKLARLFSLIYLGDFTSVYLAVLNGVDPSPVERIELLKQRLV